MLASVTYAGFDGVLDTATNIGRRPLWPNLTPNQISTLLLPVHLKTWFCWGCPLPLLSIAVHFLSIALAKL